MRPLGTMLQAIFCCNLRPLKKKRFVHYRIFYAKLLQYQTCVIQFDNS